MNCAIARAPRRVDVELVTDAAVIGRYLEDAAHYPGGHAAAVARPRDADAIAAVVMHARSVLPVGAQSSLTGGATPSGDVVLSTERLTGIHVAGDRVVAGAGATLQALQDALAPRAWLPPVPTYLGATVGGAVATNAAGAATFKYGAVREWVQALTVVLPSGDILSIARGAVTASDAGSFVIRTRDGDRHVIVPAVQMPDVVKRSAGYFAAPGMDLVDLFIGAEGTLGVIADVELRVQPRPAGICWVLVPVRTEDAAIALTGDLREAAQATWSARDPHGLDIAAIEHIDRRALEVVREDGVTRRLGIDLTPDVEVVLLVQIELGPEAAARDLWSDLGEGLAAQAADTPLGRLCRLLASHDALDSAEVALPSDVRRAAAFVELREAVPSGVNRRVALARAADDRIHKTAADMIVPYQHFAAMMRECREMCARADLDLAVWGHISDGNVHPNILPRTFDDVERGRGMILELARWVIARGGCPLAEHGVGRNPVKQRLLHMLYGDAGLDAMRQVKRSLDPAWKLAPGVLFPM